MESKLVINVGGMFSGKTTELLRQGKRHTLAKDVVVYVKPDIDNRYSDTKIVSHDGEASDYTKSLTVKNAREILKYFEVMTADVILIDEVQFFTEEIVDVIHILLSKGKKVYCSGLDLSFDYQPFETTNKIMAYADVVNKFKAVCSDCGKDAYITAKKGMEGVTTDKIDVGSTDKYIPLCRKCYLDKNIGGLV